MRALIQPQSVSAYTLMFASWPLASRFRVVSGAVAYFSRNAFETDLPIVVRSFCFLYVAYSPPMSAMSSVIVRAGEIFASIASGAFELEHSASVVRALLESVSGAPGTWSR